MSIHILQSNIRYIRKKKNLTISQVGDILEMKTPTVGAWERKRSSPDLSNIIKLSQLFGCSIDELCRKDLSK